MVLIKLKLFKSPREASRYERIFLLRPTHTDHGTVLFDRIDDFSENTLLIPGETLAVYRQPKGLIF